MRSRIAGLVRRLCWALLISLHRAGLARAVNRLANRLKRSDEAPFVRRRRSGSVQILVYHRVTPAEDPYLPSVPLEDFARQMECLARWFHVMDLLEAVEALREGRVPENAVVITFDDGYRDNFDFAYPILSGLALPATIFLATGVIGTRDVLWHDRVFRMFALTEISQLTGFGPDRTTLPLHDSAHRRATRDAVLEQLKRLDPRRRDPLIDELAAKLVVADDASRERLMLTWDEVRQMHRGGMSFGAHTVTHSVLSTISRAEQRREIVHSKKEIDASLQIDVRAFAYPNGRRGDFDPATKDLLRQSGFTCAVTTIPGGNSREHPSWDPLELHRGGLGNLDASAFLTKMNVYRFLH